MGVSEKNFIRETSSLHLARGRTVAGFLIFCPNSWFFGILIQGVDFSTVSANIAEKIEKSMIFRPKIDFDQNCAQLRKKQSKPFPTPKDSPKNIYKRPRNRDFSAFLEGGQGDGRILLG